MPLEIKTIFISQKTGKEKQEHLNTEAKYGLKIQVSLKNEAYFKTVQMKEPRQTWRGNDSGSSAGSTTVVPHLQLQGKKP